MEALGISDVNWIAEDGEVGELRLELLRLELLLRLFSPRRDRDGNRQRQQHGLRSARTKLLMPDVLKHQKRVFSVHPPHAE